MVKPGQHLLRGEGTKPKSCAPGLQGWNDLIQVVADDAKSNVVCEFLNNCEKITN